MRSQIEEQDWEAKLGNKHWETILGSNTGKQYWEAMLRSNVGKQYWEAILGFVL